IRSPTQTRLLRAQRDHAESRASCEPQTRSVSSPHRVALVRLTEPPRSRHSSSQPQVFVVVLQFGPRRLAAEAAFVRHPTPAQSPVVVLHTAGTPKPAQSALVVHLMAGQSVLVRHAQWATGPAPTPPGMQVAPAGLPAQSAFVTQPTQRPVDVLQVVAC